MSALFNNSHYTKKFQETVDYLKKKKKVLFITTSNRYKEEKEKPKSTVLAYLLSKEIGEDKVTIIDASSLKIYNSFKISYGYLLMFNLVFWIEYESLNSLNCNKNYLTT